jgi:RNA polymerase sigma-B factor
MPFEDGTFAHEKVGADDSQFESFEMSQDLTKAMRILTDQEKSLLKMRYQKGMTQSAIAKVFGMTQMQVSRMERRVLSALKEEMLKD